MLTVSAVAPGCYELPFNLSDVIPLVRGLAAAYFPLEHPLPMVVVPPTSNGPGGCPPRGQSLPGGAPVVGGVAMTLTAPGPHGSRCPVRSPLTGGD